ncbi:MAG: flagellar basal body L-ring protein FlgH [Planctomycetota bacterium]|nr:flagellar basal body L-ring protein FlgH [Planctomycetota bacterium]
MGITAVSRGLAAIVVGLTVGIGAAKGQNAPSAPVGAPASNSETPGVSALTAGDRPAVPIGVLVQRSGGSLARAEINNQTDPAAAGPSSVSFLAVPTPTPKLVHKHDLVTIIVNEQSTFSVNGLTDLKHSSDLDAQIDAYIQFRLANLSVSQFNPATPIELKGSATHNFKGEATVNRTDSLITQVTAEVVDVKPNGTVVLEASTKVKTDEEEQKIVLTGVCRVEDITADNSVLSTQLHNLDVKKTHTGAVRDTTERGWVPRLLDTINPF